MLRSVLTAFALLACSSLTQAATLYVNNQSGNDRFNNGRAERLVGEGLGPLRTLARAAKMATSSDTIVLVDTGVPYRESVTLFGKKNSGLDGLPFILDGGGATLDGSDPVPGDVWQAVSDDVFRFRPQHMAHQQLFNDGKPVLRRPVPRDATHLPKLKPLEWALHGGYIYFCVEETKIPKDYDLTYAVRRVGLTMMYVRHVIVKDLVVQGYQLDGISLHNSARECTLLGVVARGNGRSGIAVGGASRVSINESVIGHNGKSQIRMEPGSYARVFDSDVFEWTAPKWDIRGGRLIVNNKDVLPER